VVTTGLAETDEPVVLLNPVAGLHVYVDAPLTASVVDCPVQIVGFGETVNIIPLMETVTWPVAVHPFKSPTTVYVVVEGGNAWTDEPVVALSPVAGLHE